VLSRIAESMFWIGRYVERAEDTARILDVQTQIMVEDPSVDIDTACRTLLGVMGTEIPEERLTLEAALYRLAFDTDEGTSISSAIGGARESARRARETLSTELWEVINSTYRTVGSGRFRAMRTQDAFRWMRERAAVINGVSTPTSSGNWKQPTGTGRVSSVMFTIQSAAGSSGESVGSSGCTCSSATSIQRWPAIGTSIGTRLWVGQPNGGLQSRWEISFGLVMSLMSRMTPPPYQ